MISVYSYSVLTDTWECVEMCTQAEKQSCAWLKSASEMASEIQKVGVQQQTYTARYKTQHTELLQL